jgi:phosphoribosylformylglycinamidine synthase
MQGRLERVLAGLFAEELGALVQVRADDRAAVMRRLAGAGLYATVVGAPNARDEIRLVRNAKPVFAGRRVDLQRAWSEVSYRMQRLRDNPACAQEEFDCILDAGDPGLSVQLRFDPYEDVAAPFVGRGARPRVAILREQGVNGQSTWQRRSTAPVGGGRRHMSDILAARVGLAGFKGIAACGGFSYGDVLGAGEGWAKSILFNARARHEFESFFGRADTFGFGVCNGCQMMASLRELIPGAADWPGFRRNRSEQFEARFVMVQVTASPSILFAGMAGSRMPIATAHGEAGGVRSLRRGARRPA